MNEFKNKKYMTLLFDSLMTFSIANQADSRHAGPLYRSSIVSSVVSLECAANICISSLGLPPEIYLQVEKFSIQGKFDFYAYTRKGVYIDKTRNEYALLRSIVSIRNDYVHPKIESTKPEDYLTDVSYGKKKAFDFDNDIRVWGQKEAILIIEAGIVFMNYFFCELCGFSSGMVTTLLASNEELKNKLIESYMVIGDDYDLLSTVETKLVYLDLRKMP